MSTWTEIDFGVTPDTYDQSGSISLDQASYLYRLTWNTRSGYWALSLYTSLGLALIEGRPLVVGGDVLERCRVLGRPAGTLTLWRTDDTFDPVAHDDLGVRAKVWYVSE